MGKQKKWGLTVGWTSDAEDGPKDVPGSVTGLPAKKRKWGIPVLNSTLDSEKDGPRSGGGYMAAAPPRHRTWGVNTLWNTTSDQLREYPGESRTEHFNGGVRGSHGDY